MGKVLHRSSRIWMLIGLLSLSGPPDGRAQEPEPVVHAVLFYSPTCPHCHEVISTFLIPLQNEYGRKLVILGLDTNQGWANEIFWAALRHYQVPEERWAVPFLIVDGEILVGGNEIPDRLRSIIDEGLAQGGIDLPDLPELIQFMEERDLLDPRYPDRRMARPAASDSPEEPTEPPESAEASGTPTQGGAGADSTPEAPAASEAAVPGDSSLAEEPAAGVGPGPSPEPSPGGATEEVEEPATEAGSSQPTSAPEPPARSGAGAPNEEGAPSGPAGSGTLGLEDAATRLETMTMRDRFNQDPVGNSLSVLVLLGMVVSLVFNAVPGRIRRRPWPIWVVPTLVALGVGVASYLSFVEVTQVEAVCGPVGDCNTVNQSEYALLFGVLPVGVLGLLGYGLILILWVLGSWGPAALRGSVKLALWGAALFGVLFSVYLTFLEPFVIGATCAWCLSSAVIMTLLLWAATPLAAGVWPGIGDRERP